MIMRRFLLALTALLLVSSAPAIVSANAPEDLFGASARVNGMGGAGTAISRDGFAAYYNPALLARCPDSHLSVGGLRVNYSLNARRTGADAPAESPAPLDNAVRGSFGACLLLPYHLAAGVAVSSGLDLLGRVTLNTRRAQPTYPLYGRNLDQVAINVGMGYRPIRQLSVGVGASVLANASLGIAVDIPLAMQRPDGTYENLAFRIDSTTLPRAAPYLGVLIEPSRRVRIGVAYRGQIALGVTEPLAIIAQFIGLTVPVPMQLSTETWYSPKQLAIGAAVDVTDNVLATADVTWYGYGDLAARSYPYIVVGDAPGTTNSVLNLLGLSATDNPDFRNVWQLRAGVEGRVGGNRHLALRGGYSVRSSALPSPQNRNTTLLDGALHSFTVGAGIAIHNAWDDSADSHDRFSAHHEDGYDGEEPTLEGDADAAERAVRTRPESHALRISARADAFMRLSVMPWQRDDVKDLRWGGTMFDMGATFSLGWR